MFIIKYIFSPNKELKIGVRHTLLNMIVCTKNVITHLQLYTFDWQVHILLDRNTCSFQWYSNICDYKHHLPNTHRYLKKISIPLFHKPKNYGFMLIENQNLEFTNPNMFYYLLRPFYSHSHSYTVVQWGYFRTFGNKSYSDKNHLKKKKKQSE